MEKEYKGNNCFLKEKKTILIMDDVKVLREYLSTILRRFGYRVIEAESGEDAINKIKFLKDKYRIYCAILDLTIKNGIDGFQTAKVLKKIDPMIKIVITSGSIDEENIKDNIDVKIDALLLKPFTVEKLNQVLESLSSGTESIPEQKTQLICAKYNEPCPIDLAHLCEGEVCYFEKCFNLINIGIAVFRKKPCRLFFVNNTGKTIAGDNINILIESIKNQLCQVLYTEKIFDYMNRVQVKDNIYGYTIYKLLENFVLVIFKDITKIENAKEVDSNRIIFSQFNRIISEIVHEIGNALAGIMALLEISIINIDTYTKKDIEVKLDAALTEIKKLSELLKLLRPLGADSSSEYRFVNVRTVLQSVVEDVLKNFKGISCFFVNFPDNWFAYVREDDFKKVVKELILNSIYFMKGKGEIIIKSEFKKNDFREIIIHDTGPGIPDDLLEKIFYPFFSTEKNKKGMGLTIARKRMLNMGGMLAAKQSKKGAKFVIYVPEK